MGWPNDKLGGVVATVLLAAAVAVRCSGDRQHESADIATVAEIAQTPMTLKNGYHPGLFPFNKGEPFVVDPSSGSIGFNTGRPPSTVMQQRSDDYYDYDSKLEEVPFDYKGDPIDRKDVVEPNAPRPNDIKPPGGNNKKQTDIYQFLNLPVKYSSSDKFPLMSSSYANTKVQGSGPTSSSLSNHKMPSAPVLTTVAPPQPSWYNYAASKTTSRTPATAATAATSTTTTTTTTTTTVAPKTTTTTTMAAPTHQEYEEEAVYDYADYYHPQEPSASASSELPQAPASTSAATYPTTTTSTTTAATTTPISTTPSTTTTTAAITSASTDRYYNSAHSVITPEPSTVGTTTTTVRVTTAAAVPDKTTGTTARPEIDSKLDGTSFADYDTPIKSTEKEHQQQPYNNQNSFKPMPGNYQFDGEQTYPLITNSKVPMTFTAHVSSGISLNQREHSSPDLKPPPPPAVLSEPVYSSRPLTQQPEIQDSNKPQQEPNKYELNTRLQTTANGRPADAGLSPSESPPTYYNNRPKPLKSNNGNVGNDQFETVYYKVRPDSYAPQIPPNAVANRPSANPPPLIQSRPPHQPESVMKTTSQTDMIRKPATNPDQLQQMSQGRPQPYPIQTEMQYTKNKPQYTGQPQYIPPQSQPQYVQATQSQPQYVAPPSQSKPQQYGGGPQSQTPQYVAPQNQPDTSKFKPPKHVINHFIKTQPNEDIKSYALQTSFSIGMDGERTADARPAQGIGQVLMVADGSSEIAVNQTMPVKSKPTMTTTSIPLVPPPRPIQKPLPYNPRPPQWDNIPKSPSYYPPPPPPKRENIPPPQRQNLPNILPQFRPNAKVDTPPPMMPPQSHSATIERVQIPMDHLRPPPLPKPQFLKVDRNDENIDEDMLDILEKESRIVQRPAGPQQPGKVTTLQMIQQASPVNKDNPVHLVYAANAPPKPSVDKLIDDSVILDVKDRSDVPILKTKTSINKPVKSDFPYQIVKPDDNQNASLLEYKAYSPTKPDPIKPNNDQELVPNLQDYVPVVTRDSVASNNVVMSQKPITATLKTSEDNHKSSAVDESHKPLLQNFQIPFQPSMKLPENSNGWSVVRKSQIDNASERTDEAGDLIASTEKFDPDNFKPHLVGGFMPISSPLKEEESKENKTVEQPERA